MLVRVLIRVLVFWVVKSPIVWVYAIFYPFLLGLNETEGTPRFGSHPMFDAYPRRNNTESLQIESDSPTHVGQRKVSASKTSRDVSRRSKKLRVTRKPKDQVSYKEAK